MKLTSAIIAFRRFLGLPEIIPRKHAPKGYKDPTFLPKGVAVLIFAPGVPYARAIRIENDSLAQEDT